MNWGFNPTPRQLQPWSKTCVVRWTYSTYEVSCFAAVGPKLWNSLPADLRQADISFQRFKLRLISFLTYLFNCDVNCVLFRTSWTNDRTTLCRTAKSTKWLRSLTGMTYLYYMYLYLLIRHSQWIKQSGHSFSRSCLPNQRNHAKFLKFELTIGLTWIIYAQTMN